MSTIPVSPTTPADAATRRVVRHEQRHLAVRLTESELLARGQELANTIQEITVEESRLATLKSQSKARLEELAGRHARLASVVRAREEYRDVVVEVVFDYDAHHVRTVRPDTGEVVDQRAMTDDERQRRLFPDDDTPEASGAGDSDAEARADHDDAGSSGDDEDDEGSEDEDDSRGPDDPPGEDDGEDAGPEADDQPHPDTAPAPARRARRPAPTAVHLPPGGVSSIPPSARRQAETAKGTRRGRRR